MPQKQAAIEAGYSPKNASQSAYQALSRIQGSVAEIMDECGLTDRALIENYLLPLLQADRTRYFHHKGRVKDKRTEAALEIRRDALDIALRIKGKYAPPAVEQANKHTVQVLVLDVPRPKRENPPPTMIELAKPVNVLPQAAQAAAGQAPNVLPRDGTGWNESKV